MDDLSSIASFDDFLDRVAENNLTGESVFDIMYHLKQLEDLVTTKEIMDYAVLNNLKNSRAVIERILKVEKVCKLKVKQYAFTYQVYNNPFIICVTELIKQNNKKINRNLG